MITSYWTQVYEYTRCPKCFGLGHLNDGWSTFTMSTDTTYPRPVEIYSKPSTECPLCKGTGRVKIVSET